MSYDTVVKDLGNNLYEISCYPAWCFMFEVIEYAPVGTVVQEGLELASCSTQDMMFSLSVDFAVRVIAVNQELIDYTRQNKGENFRYSRFEQTDWICVVEKTEYYKDTNPVFNAKLDKLTPSTWHRFTNATTANIGFFKADLPTQIYCRNFVLLGDTFVKGDKICKFEYYPKFASLLDDDNKWVLAEKYKQTGYLYTPCDVEQILSFNPAILGQAQYNPQPHNWILVDIKHDFILTLQRKITFYTYGFAWYKLEGDFIRIGLNADKHEYISGHKPCFPYGCYAKPNDIFLSSEPINYLCEIDVSGPMITYFSPDFDMEIVEVNPKIWGNANEPCDVLTNDCYGEGWLFLVKPLDAAATQKLFEQWYKQDYFI